MGQTALDFNGDLINLKGDFDIFVAGLDNCGNKIFFANAGNNNAGNDINQIVADNKYVYITGTLLGTGIYDFNNTLQPLKGAGDILVAGLNQCNGKQKFFKTAGGIDLDIGNSLTVNDNGIFITGKLGSGASDFNSTAVSLYGVGDIFVAGLDKCGNQIFFKNAGGGNNIIEPSFGTNITSDCENIFVTGEIAGITATDFNGNEINQTNGSIFVSGLDPLGNQLFFKTAGSNISTSKSILTNDHGVFITGETQFVYNDFTGKSFTKSSITNANNGLAYVSGLTKCGKQKFFVTAGTTGSSEGINITSDDNGIYVTGYIYGPDATDFSGNPISNLQGIEDIFVAKLDFCGRQQFFLTAGSSDNDFGNQIVVRNNEIYVTGVMGGVTGINFKHCPVTTLKDNGDVFVARLDDLCGHKRSTRSTMPYIPR